MRKLFVFFVLLFSFSTISAQKYEILKISDDFIEVQVNFEGIYTMGDTLIDGVKYTYINNGSPNVVEPGKPSLPFYAFQAGVPFNSDLSVQVIDVKSVKYDNKFIIPQLDDEVTLDGIKNELYYDEDTYSRNINFPDAVARVTDDYIMRNARVASVTIAPYMFNPVTRELVYNSLVKVRLYFKSNGTSANFKPEYDKFSDEFLTRNVINAEQARSFIGTMMPNEANTDLYLWYDHNKKYLKVYVSTEGVYRLTYENLIQSGLNVDGINIDKLEMFSTAGEVPLEIIDDGDSLFNSGDYLQFVGFPPKATPYAKSNIYNYKNIYWLSAEADDSGLRYKVKNSYPDLPGIAVQKTFGKIFLEKDTLYERLGHAEDEKRDYWYWARVAGDNGTPTKNFSTSYTFPGNRDETQKNFTVRVKFHGMTTGSHKANVYILSQKIGSVEWTGQEEKIFEKVVSTDSINLAPTINVQVEAPGGLLYGESDEIRVNWIEIEFQQLNRVFGEYFAFNALPEKYGIAAKYEIWRWQSDSLKVYIPNRGELLKNAWDLNNGFGGWVFQDTTMDSTKYYLVSDDYFKTPDSLAININSNLRATTNGADYIIITHPDFMDAAIELGVFRKDNLEGYDQARIKIVNVMDIYQEFSYGMLDPNAIKRFLEHAFFFWEKPFPEYVVLMGDMSYDYRGLIKSSRKNYIPSIPIHSVRYGQAVSDNQFVCVSGDDPIPEMAIGRLSCETLAEAKELVKKIKEYPVDTDKYWHQNTLMIGAGQHDRDENRFGFNDQALFLDEAYIQPAGYSSDKVFLFPNKPSHYPFEGGTTEIRESFNKGAVVANFYGHGGGYQWDAVFITDDIYLLQNEGRLPFITSITCYTAHFDNQKVFGEQFNLVPDKGSIGFWGHTGITFWAYGLDLNKKLYNEIFLDGEFTIGKALLNAKGAYSTNVVDITRDHLNLLTYLGDPGVKLAFPEHPDFVVRSSGISINPTAPLAEDSVVISVELENIGRIFPNDTAKVNLFVSGPDSSYQLGSLDLTSFGHSDTVYFGWRPKVAGLFTLEVQVNLEDQIEEGDFSDNTAQKNFAVFSLSEPSIVKPADGVRLNNKSVEFLLADVGEYIQTDLGYFIEIDTSISFDNPIVQSEELTSKNTGLVRFTHTFNDTGIYFWRSRIKNGDKYSNWSQTRTLRVTSVESDFGYFISGKQLTNVEHENLVYNEENDALELTRETFPPEPREYRRLEDAYPTLPADVHSLTAIATDGTYLYFGHMAYYGLINANYTEATYIYRMGTGFNGTILGEIDGPVSNVKIPIWKSMFYYQGNIYVASGKAHKLTKLDLQTGDTTHVYIPNGMLSDLQTLVQDGGHYVNTDGRYVYNIAFVDSNKNFRYTLRTFDPENNWEQVGTDTLLSGESFEGFSSFFFAKNYLYVLEKNIGNYMRKYDMNTYLHLNEWSLNRFVVESYYCMTYDDENDVVYGFVYGGLQAPRVSIYKGTYNEGNGSLTTPSIGPATNWNNAGYIVDDTGSQAEYSVLLEGYKKATNSWEPVSASVTPSFDLSFLPAEEYPFIRMNFDFVDTSNGENEKIKLKDVHVGYESMAEVVLSDSYITFEPDTAMQGFDVNANVEVRNVGYDRADSVKVDFYLNNSDTAFYSSYVNIEADSSVVLTKSIETSILTRDRFHSVEANGVSKSPEMYTFNNLAADSFFVSRDSTRPEFNITFDGREIIDGDLISSRPTVVITMDDNSPLPLQKEYFTIEHSFNNLSNILKFQEEDSLKYDYTPYPNSKVTITWTPELGDGNHRLDIFASDASSNPFSNTGYSVSFRVDTENNVEDIYNYPNPFSNDTWFTFTLTGNDIPEELRIKIFTVAGRLIREIKVPVETTDIKLLNKVYWDGKDEDGSDIANGVYIYKVIARYPDKTVTEIHKMARVR